MKRKALGDWGEAVAAQFLHKKGFAILERNFRVLRGEIDIIARRGALIVFVEVKTGFSKKFGAPEEKVNLAKQRRLYRVASYYIQGHPDLQVDYRFDVVVVDGAPDRYEIRYYPNAFYL